MLGALRSKAPGGGGGVCGGLDEVLGEGLADVLAGVLAGVLGDAVGEVVGEVLGGVGLGEVVGEVVGEVLGTSIVLGAESVAVCLLFTMYNKLFLCLRSKLGFSMQKFGNTCAAYK